MRFLPLKVYLGCAIAILCILGVSNLKTLIFLGFRAIVISLSKILSHLKLQFVIFLGLSENEVIYLVGL